MSAASNQLGPSKSSAESAAAIRFVMSIWVGFTLMRAALVVLLPLHLVVIGFGAGPTAAVVGASGVGGIISAEAVGRTADRMGPANLLRLGAVAMAGFFVAIGFARNVVVLLILHALVGVCIAAIRVSTQLVVRHRVTATRRGRVHGNQGLMTRVTMLLVPVAAGFLWERFDPEPNFVFPALIALAAAAVAGSLTVSTASTVDGARERVVPFAQLLRFASGPILFNSARAGRMLLLPLIGLELELPPSRIGLLVGLTAAADVLVSPISGPMMDMRGRLATIVPAFSLMAFGFVLLFLANGGWLLVIAAVVLGLGNGFSSGLLLTLGGDLAPRGNEGAFLGRFGAMTDAGRLLGPFLVGVLGEVLNLNAAALALAVVTLAGLACILIFVGETKPAS